MGNKKNTQHKQEKHRILPRFVKWKIWAFYWAQCHWQRSEKGPQREWRILATTLGPDDHLLCAVKVPVGRLRMKTEVAKMERWDRKAAVFPSFQNEIQRIAFQENLLRKSNRHGKLFRAARCEACSSTQLEAIKVHVGHCHNCPVKTFVLFSRHTQRRPLQTLGMIILFFFFF